MANADIKRIKILDAATKRFAHYGMLKTTMSDIAKDLNISKALLYYYFPDKNTLFSAVFEYVVTRMHKTVDKRIKQSGDVETILLYAIDKRIELINNYYHLFEYSINLIRDLPDQLQNVLKEVHEKEVDVIAKILKKGMDNQEIEVDNVIESAEILQFSFIGIRFSIIKNIQQVSFFPTKEEFDIIANLQKKLAKTYINGLRKIRLSSTDGV